MKIVLVSVTVLCLLASVNAAKLDSPSSYIINGEDVSSVIPFYAYLEIFQNPGMQGNMFFGGAALISTNAAITVAQNVVGFGSFRIGLGAVQIRDLEWYNVASVVSHPNYNPATLGDNIAVLRLIAEVTISERIFPISRLPEVSTFPHENEITHVIGFGFGEIDHQPTILQEAPLSVLSQAACGNAFPHLVNSGQLPNYFCATNPITRANICAGDQGGPIYKRDLNILVGLTSFNRYANCSIEISHPGAFIRVNQYNQFINAALAA